MVPVTDRMAHNRIDGDGASQLGFEQTSGNSGFCWRCRNPEAPMVTVYDRAGRPRRACRNCRDEQERRARD